VGLAESDGLAWLLQVNDLLGSEKLGPFGVVVWILRVWVRDACESLKDSVLTVGEVAGRDLVNGSLSEEWMVLGAELREAIVELAFGRCEGEVL